MSSGAIVRVGILLCEFAALSAFAETPPRAALYMDDGCCGMSNALNEVQRQRMQPLKKPVPKIILDSDMLSDFDDVGAAAMLHTFADRGECEILATVACTVDGVSPQVLELINA